MSETMSNKTNYYDNLPPAQETNAPAVETVTPQPVEATTVTDNSQNDDWKNFDFSKLPTEDKRWTRTLSRSEIVHFVVVGLISGVVVWLARMAMESWVMKPLFCRTPDTATVCSAAPTTSFVIALVVVGIIATGVLSHQKTARALLISVATFVSLGALWHMLDSFSWLAAVGAAAGFTALLILFFGYIVTIKRYFVAMLLMAALVAGFWLLALS